MEESREKSERNREQHLREQPETQARLRLAAIVESSDDAIIGKDLNGIITDWNNGAERLYGYSAHEVIGKPISILLPADRRDDFAAIMKKIRAGEMIKQFETVRQKKDGTHVEVSLTVSPIIDPEGRIVGASTIARDISEYKHQESVLREREERFQLAMGNVASGVYTLDLQGLVTYVNPAAEAMFGWTNAELLGRKMHNVTHYKYPDGRPFPASECPGLQVLQKGVELREYSDAFIRRDGSFFPVVYSSSPLKRGNETVGVVVAFRDDTESREGERALRESEERLRMAVQAGRMFAYEWDAATDQVALSGVVKEILGEDVGVHDTAQNILTMIPAEDRERVMAAAAQLTPEKPFLQIRHRIVRDKGTTIWAERSGRAYFDEHGKMLRTVGMLVDVTDRVRAEEALQVSQRQLSLVYSNVADTIFYVAVESDGRYRFLSVNPAFLKTTGLAEDQVVGKLVQEVIPEPSLTMVLGKYEEAIGDKKTVRWEETSEYPTGRMVGEVTVAPIFDGTGQCKHLIGAVHDITERKRAEEALRQKESELAEAQRLAGVGSWHRDARNDTVTWSEQLYRIAGLDPALPAPVFKEHRRQFTAESWERLQRAVEEALRDGKSYQLDLELARPDGATRWMTARGEAVADTSGRIVGLRGTSQDITERKRAEEALAGMSRKLLEAQEQERARIGRELHDDVNQRLALLSVEIQRVREVSPVTYGELRSRMDELGKQTTEISAVVQSLSHELHSSRLEYLGLASAMKGFCKEFADKHKLEIDFSSEGIPPSVPQEVSLCLFRVMQEGLQNAVKHSGVRFFEVRLHGSPAEIHLTVRDSGVGFDRELAKDTQGLGLISMQERVRLVKGTISITSRPQSGTEINVRVPLSSGAQTDQAKLAGA